MDVPVELEEAEGAVESLTEAGKPLKDRDRLHGNGHTHTHTYVHRYADTHAALAGQVR